MKTKSVSSAIAGVSLIFLSGLVALGISGCSSQSAKLQQALVNRDAPYTRFTMIDGQPMLLEELKGKKVFLMFWTTWCPHSRPAIEEFNEIAEKFSRRSDLYFLAASVDSIDAFNDVQSRISTKHLSSINHAFSGNDLQDEAFLLFKGDEVPYFIVIGPTGRVERVGHSVSVVEDALGL